MSPKWWRCGPVCRSSRIAGEERERLLEMERVMHQRIIGQERADQGHLPRLCAARAPA
jgi:ATP-dependent Clp protease ATP-binding subunit ClpA